MPNKNGPFLSAVSAFFIAAFLSNSFAYTNESNPDMQDLYDCMHAQVAAGNNDAQVMTKCQSIANEYLDYLPEGARQHLRQVLRHQLLARLQKEKQNLSK